MALTLCIDLRHKIREMRKSNNLMKNESNEMNFKIRVMNKSLHIQTTLDQPDLLEDLVEKLACRRYDIGYGKQKMPLNYKALETSSTETFASGTVTFQDNNEDINMPFITSFLFTCVKTEHDPYKLAWSFSLS